VPILIAKGHGTMSAKYQARGKDRKLSVLLTLNINESIFVRVKGLGLYVDRLHIQTGFRSVYI
jgi:hypothetical protein